MIRKRGQGEIFGMALLFVIIVFGLLFYTKYKAISKSNKVVDTDYQKLEKLVDSSLSTFLNIGTDCYVERYSNRVIDLIKYCIIREYGGSNDLTITCKSESKNACSYSLEIINKSLNKVYNSSDFYMIPYIVKFNLPTNPDSIYNTNITNFNYFGITLNNYREKGYLTKVSSKAVVPTSQGPLEIVLEVYLKGIRN